MISLPCVRFLSTSTWDSMDSVQALLFRWSMDAPLYYASLAFGRFHCKSGPIGLGMMFLFSFRFSEPCLFFGSTFYFPLMSFNNHSFTHDARATPDFHSFLSIPAKCIATATPSCLLSLVSLPRYPLCSYNTFVAFDERPFYNPMSNLSHSAGLNCRFDSIDFNLNRLGIF